MKTIKEQIDCVKRELALRKAVYPKQVEKGKMKPETATHETESMQAVLVTLIKVSDTSLQDVEVASETPDPAKRLYQQFVGIYNDFCKRTIGTPAKMDGAQGKALKAIIEYLKEATTDKSDAGVLHSWTFILGKWDLVGDFIGKQKSLTQINKNLIEILDKIRNGHDKKSAGKSRRQQLSIELETKRTRSAGTRNQWT